MFKCVLRMNRSQMEHKLYLVIMEKKKKRKKKKKKKKKKKQMCYNPNRENKYRGLFLTRMAT